jgi:DNA-binding MarR family transcriptional regulator
MSRTDLKEFLARRMKHMTPEREELIGAVLHESRRSATRTVVFHAAIADRLGLNPSDHKCADLICNETGPITAGRLAEITGLSTGAITGVVDRLEKAGFVARVPDATDRRRVVIQGVEHGKAPDLRHLFVPMMEGMAMVCEGYTDEQLALIVGFMQRTGALTEAQIANLRQAIELPAQVQGKAPETPAKPAPSAAKAAPAKAAVRKR